MDLNCDFVYNSIGCCATKILRFYLWAPGVPGGVVLTPRLL